MKPKRSQQILSTSIFPLQYQSCRARLAITLFISERLDIKRYTIWHIVGYRVCVQFLSSFCLFQALPLLLLNSFTTVLRVLYPLHLRHVALEVLGVQEVPLKKSKTFLFHTSGLKI